MPALEDDSGATPTEQPIPSQPCTENGLVNRQASDLEVTLHMLACLAAEAEAEIALDASFKEEREQVETLIRSRPSLHNLCELPAEEVALSCLAVLRGLASPSAEAAATVAEERQVFAWSHEWLDLGQEKRTRFSQLLIKGLISQPPAVLATHLSLIIELRFSCWEPSANADAQKRNARGIRAGRAVLVSLAALKAEELDALGEAFVTAIQQGISPLGAAIVVVQLTPHRRSQLERLLVYEDMMPQDQAKRVFNSMTWLISKLGVERLEATLSALDSALYLGSDALDAGSYALGTLSSLGAEAMSTVGSTVGALSSEVADFGSGVAYVISDAAAASAGAAAAMLFSTTVPVPNGYTGSATEAEAHTVQADPERRATWHCTRARPPTKAARNRTSVEGKRHTVLPSQASDFL